MTPNGKITRFDLEEAKFTSRQMEFVRAMSQPTTKYGLYGGAMGGGKSYCLRWSAVRTLLRIFAKYGLRNVEVMLACEDYPALKDRQVSKIAMEFSNRLGKLHRDHPAYGRSFVLRPEYGSGVIALRNLDDPSKYQSAEFAAIFLDEMTKNPVSVFDFLRNRLRWPGLPDHECKLYGASNPGGVGHGWNKQYFVDRVLPPEFEGRENQFVFVRALASDNPHLTPEYEENTLGTLPTLLRRAFRDGDWNVFMGQAFPEWSEARHVIRPHPIPSGAKIYMTMDWGYGRPFSIGWWYVDAEGRLIRVAEWYGWNGTPNEGIRMPDTQVADGIVKRERDADIEQVTVRWAGHDCFAKKPDYNGGGQGPSTAEVYALKGLYLTKGDSARALKMRAFRERLEREINGRPMLQVFETCTHFRRTIPTLVMDDHNPEDIDTDGEDHVYDEACHIVMGRPMAMAGPRVRKSRTDREIEELLRPDRDSLTARAGYANQRFERDILRADNDDYEEVIPTL